MPRVFSKGYSRYFCIGLCPGLGEPERFIFGDQCDFYFCGQFLSPLTVDLGQALKVRFQASTCRTGFHRDFDNACSARTWREKGCRSWLRRISGTTLHLSGPAAPDDNQAIT
jgi:hypothetical protein